MNRYTEKKVRLPNPFLKSAILSKITYWWVRKDLSIVARNFKFQCHILDASFFPLVFLMGRKFEICRWMRRLFATGVKRPIEDDDIYMVPKDLQCEKNTNDFAHLWNMQLKKHRPSIFRVILKLHRRIFPIGILYAITETFARWYLDFQMNTISLEHVLFLRDVIWTASKNWCRKKSIRLCVFVWYRFSTWQPDFFNKIEMKMSQSSLLGWYWLVTRGFNSFEFFFEMNQGDTFIACIPKMPRVDTRE